MNYQEILFTPLIVCRQVRQMGVSMKHTILVIDDDKNICEIVKECMTEGCYDFDIAYDGKTGLLMLKSKSYHLVILDIMLPGINGYHVLDKIRQTSTIPVLMIILQNPFVSKN